MTATPAQITVDPANLRRLAEHATRGNFGTTVYRVVDLTAAYRIDLSSWPRQQEVYRELLDAGYQVVETSPPGGHGAALLVTGWHEGHLEDRVKRLQLDVGTLERDHAVTAESALDRWLDLTYYGEHSTTGDVTTEDQADELVMKETRTLVEQCTSRPRVRGTAHRPTELELTRTTGVVQARLTWIAAYEKAVDTLIREHLTVAEAAIGMYREYRDQHGADAPEEARNKALNEVQEGTLAISQLALDDLCAWLDDQTENEITATQSGPG